VEKKNTFLNKNLKKREESERNKNFQAKQKEEIEIPHLGGRVHRS